VYYENGTARNYDGRTMVNHAPLAMRAGSTVVTVVYSSGVATLPIRQGAAGMQLTVCKGLNESSMAAFVWDAVASTRGYAITEEGDTLVAIVQSAASNAVQPSKSKDGGAPIKGPMCLIRSRSSSGLPSGPLAAMHIKGYLLALSQRRSRLTPAPAYTPLHTADECGHFQHHISIQRHHEGGFSGAPSGACSRAWSPI